MTALDTNILVHNAARTFAKAIIPSRRAITPETTLRLGSN